MTALETQLRNSVALLGGDTKTKEVPMSDQLAVTNVTDAPAGRQLLFAIQSFEDCWRVSKLLSSTDFVPMSYRGKPEATFAAIMMGHELGLGPLQALQGIAVINNRPSVWGDLALALAQRHRDFVDCVETFDARTFTATCTIKRKGRADKTHSFSLEMAKRAKLTDKRDTPWQTYPERMCQMRARSWAIRDQFADALRGLSIVEEVVDYANGTATVTLENVPRTVPAVATMPQVELQPPAAAMPALASVPTMPPTAAMYSSPQVTVEAVASITSPESFEIRAGKNKGKRLGELGFKQLEWYSTECKDLPTREAAKQVFIARYPTGQEPVSNVEYIDRDGVVSNNNQVA